MHDSPQAMPGKYSKEIRLIQEYGWTWSDIQNAPGDLIHELLAHLHYRAHWQQERSRIDAQKARMKSRHG